MIASDGLSDSRTRLDDQIMLADLKIQLTLEKTGQLGQIWVRFSKPDLA